MKRETGARALRSIIEEFMLDIMYEIPKDDNIGQVTITREYIEGTPSFFFMLPQAIRILQPLQPYETIGYIDFTLKHMRALTKRALCKMF